MRSPPQAASSGGAWFGAHALIAGAQVGNGTTASGAVGQSPRHLAARVAGQSRPGRRLGPVRVAEELADGWADYAATLAEMYPWPRWEVARLASIQTGEG